jgi:hypothetical protein
MKFFRVEEAPRQKRNPVTAAGTQTTSNQLRHCGDPLDLGPHNFTRLVLPGQDVSRGVAGGRLRGG